MVYIGSCHLFICGQATAISNSNVNSGASDCLGMCVAESSK